MSSRTSGAATRGRLRRSRNALIAGVAALLLCAVAACGGGGGGDQGGGQQPAAPSGDTFPQTLPSPFGQTTTLNAAPTRVVTLGIGPVERDTPLALGIVPVAVGGYAPAESWFTQRAGKPVEYLDVSSGIPFEKIASLNPDLIIAGTGDEAGYKQLAAIAPVLWMADTATSSPWQDQTTKISKALGRSADGQKLVADTEARIKAAAAANPSLAGKSFTWNLYSPGMVSSVDLPTAPVIPFLGSLGMQLKPGLANPKSSYSLSVSPEQIDKIDADVIIVLPSGAEARANLEGLRNWQNLNGVRKGGAVFLNDEQGNAINTPSVLSIPFVLDGVVPQLAKAAQG